MDNTDELSEVYEALVFWADVVLIATSIRWGAPSSLYFKMIERMNCIQNQITIHDRVLIRNKVAGFVITGGQDNVQAVVGQMMMFFGELGFTFPQFPFVAHIGGGYGEQYGTCAERPGFTGRHQGTQRPMSQVGRQLGGLRRRNHDNRRWWAEGPHVEVTSASRPVGDQIFVIVCQIASMI